MSSNAEESAPELVDGAEGPRWGRGRYLMSWALLSGAQGLTLQSVAVLLRDGTPGENLWIYGVGILLLQVMKLVPTLGRLHDLGRRPDDALWTLVPLMNVALWTWLLAPTPSEARRRARLNAWRGTLQALPAYGMGARRAAGLWGAGGVAAVWLVFAHVAVNGIAAWLLTLDPEGRRSVGEAATLVFGVLAFYALWRAVKGRQLPVGAWWPVWWLVPAGGLSLLLTSDLSFMDRGTAGLMAVTGLKLSVMVALLPVAWAMAMAVWLPALERRAGREPGPVSRPALLQAALGRDVVVQLGLQVVLPGVWFAIRWALADVAALRSPQASPFRVSSEVVASRQGSVLKVLLVYVMGSFALSLITVPLVGGAAWQAVAMGADVLPPAASLLEAVVLAPWGLLLAAALREVADDAGLGDEAPPS